MARALWLPAVLRAAGLTVVEWDGWKTRGRDAFYPRGTIEHATASSRHATINGDISVLLNGSNTAPPPIAQCYLARNGVWYVIASGACNHALVGWAGPHKGYGNRELLGIEAANDNGLEKPPEAWPTVQYESYVRGIAAIHKSQGWPVKYAVGHKEHQPPGYAGHTSIKSDPTFDMAIFRDRVAAVIDGGELEGDDMSAASDTVIYELRPWTVDIARRTERLEAGMAAEVIRDQTLKVAVDALAATIAAGGGSVDTAAILARIDQATAAESAAVKALQADLAGVREELVETRRRLAAALAGS